MTNFNYNPFISGTKGDQHHKYVIKKILKNGCLDKNPRPHYADGTPAHTFSYNGEFCQYNLSHREFPIITLRPIACKSAIGELLWIYQDQTTDLDVLKDKYKVTWWDSWDVGDRTIGQCYGATVRKHNIINNLLDGIKKDPDGRRHIINLWQYEDFKLPHGLKPCAFLTLFNVRHADKDYLDMMLVIRSQDYPTAGVINQVQYCVLQCLIARHCGYEPGIFTYVCDNIQIYDRHIEGAKKLLDRDGINCKPYVWLNPDKNNFYDFTIDDIKIADYPMDDIKKMNPQITDFRDNIAI